MSNARRIWLSYAIAALMLFGIWGLPLIGILIGLPDDWIGASAFVGFLAAFGLWIAYWLSRWSKCWRCSAPLSLKWGGYQPVVWWTRCPTCGVRHSARPDDVRTNPMSHLKSGGP